MANANPPTRNPISLTRFKFVKLIAMFFLALTVVVGLTVLINWLTMKPKKLVYSIDDGSIHHYNLSKGNHLNATYNFIFSAYNPNKRVSIYYGKVAIGVLYHDETISRGTIDPFYQPKRNTTSFNLNLASHDVMLVGPIAHDLEVDRSLGQVELGLKLNARVKFKMGVWKSRQYRMKISCAPIVVQVSSSYSKGFQRTICDVDF